MGRATNEEIWKTFKHIWSTCCGKTTLNFTEKKEAYRKLSHLWMALPLEQRQEHKAKLTAIDAQIIDLLEQLYEANEILFRPIKESSDTTESDQCGNSAQA